MDISTISSAAKAIRSTQLELTKLLEEAKNSNSNKRNGETRLGAVTSQMDLEDLEEKSVENDLSVDNECERRRYHADFSRMEEQLRVVKEKCKILSKENSELKTKYTHLQRRFTRLAECVKTEQNKTAEAEATNERLRQLLARNMKRTEQVNSKREKAEDFLNRLSLDDSMLDSSEPVLGVEAKPPLRVESVNATALVRVNTKLKKNEIEIRQLKEKLEKVMEENIKIKSSQKSRLRRNKTEASNQHLRLLGALRRIQYLIEEKNQMTANLKKRDSYVRKLESKLLKLDKDLEVVEKSQLTEAIEKKSEQIVFPRGDATSMIRGSIEELPQEEKSLLIKWDTVYLQDKLATPPSDRENKDNITYTNILKPVDSKYFEWERSREIIDSVDQNDHHVPESMNMSGITETTARSVSSIKVTENSETHSGQFDFDDADYGTSEDNDWLDEFETELED